MSTPTDPSSKALGGQLTTSAGNPVADNQNSLRAGPLGPLLLQDYQLIEKLAHQNRERIPESPVHAKGWGAHGTLTISGDISKYTKAKVLQPGAKTALGRSYGCWLTCPRRRAHLRGCAKNSVSPGIYRCSRESCMHGSADCAAIAISTLTFGVTLATERAVHPNPIPAGV